jgi:hypothetical protein
MSKSRKRDANGKDESNIEEKQRVIEEYFTKT